MQEASELKLNVVANALAIETREERRRCCPIKTFVMKKNANLHWACLGAEFCGLEAARAAL